MNLFKNIGKAMGGAINLLGEKNRKSAYLNRIRTVIQCEEKAAEKEYLALGRYYYNNLRDPNNSVTEGHCAQLEAIEARLDKALNQLEKFYSQPEVKEPVSETSDTEPSEQEEVTLEGIESFDYDPLAAGEPAADLTAPVEETPAQGEEAAPCPASISGVPEAHPAMPDENDSLPFEG